MPKPPQTSTLVLTEDERIEILTALRFLQDWRNRQTPAEQFSGTLRTRVEAAAHQVRLLNEACVEKLRNPT